VDFPTIKLAPSAGFAASNMRAKPVKRPKCGAIWRIFAETPISFALPVRPNPRILTARHAGMCGPAGSFSFFDSARRREWLKVR